MVRKASLRNILWSVQINGYGGKVVEFYNISGLFTNISTLDGFVKFSTGQNIILTKSFLNAEWDTVSNKKTLVEACVESSTVTDSSVVGVFGNINSSVTSMLLNTPVYNLNSLTLQEIAEKKNWFIKTFTPPNPNFRSPSLPEGTDPMLETFDFTSAIDKLNGFTTPKYIIQFTTNKKLYLDADGIKDATTNNLIELTPELYTGGKWYTGENVQGEDTMLTITDALNTINWTTQELVYRKGTTAEVVIKTKIDYENKTLSSLLVGKSEVSNSKISALLVDANWSLKNK